MKKISVSILLFVVTLFIYSCTKDDGTSVEPARDYSDQYLKDIDSIDKFIDTHFMTVDADYNVTFTEITDETPGTPIRNNPNLQFKMIDNYDEDGDDFQYKVYYIKLREGVNERPTRVDSVFASYKGVLATTTAQFDYAEQPVWFQLEGVVRGWSEIFPLFKTGTYDTDEGPNPVTYDNYGAGVMFLPSGLAYYNNSSSSGTIPAYSNLIFSFKLFELQYKDHDRDGIPSRFEVATQLNSDESNLDEYNKESNFLDYDSDDDEYANMFDIDDDADGIQTRGEIILTASPQTLYPFSGIPDCNGNTTDPARIRRHLVKCNP